ncbi:metallophosphatase [Streptococcaceae bacterium ESL0687]|nr:metallophosphatase [Streptococcaceae bacterium ESL0687]
MEQIKILHINDLHSHFEKLPKIERFFRDNKDDHTLAFDIGDNVDRSHPLTEATFGRANVDFLNRLGLTGATIGNNEGLSLDHDALNALYENANFPVILSNLKEKGELPFWAQDKLIVQTESGLKIGILGLTYPYPRAYNPFGWEIEDPLVSLERMLDDLDNLNCDFVILLSHLGIRYDEEIADKYKVDLILGAHTHHVFEEGVEKNGTLMAAAGSYGEYVGQIILTFDDHKKLQKSEIIALPTNILPSRKSDLTTTNSWLLKGEKLLESRGDISLGQQFTNVSPTYEASHFIGQVFADYAKVPAAILNSGLIVYDLPEKISPAELLRILPHSMRLVRYEVEGQAFKEILAELVEVAGLLKGQAIHGMGFRGKIFGELIFCGIEKTSDGGFLYNGQEIKDDLTYQFAMPDQYYFAKYFPSLKKNGRAEILFPKFLREIVYTYLRGEDE